MRHLPGIAASLSLCGLLASGADAALNCRLGYASPRSYDRGLALRVGVQVADFDGDGLPDVASLHRYGNDGTPDRTGTLMLNRGHDVFDQKPIVAFGDFGTIQAGLLDADSIPDLILGGSTPLTVLYGNGDGTFHHGGITDIRNVTSIAVGQFDGKGAADIAVAQSSPPSLTILLAGANETYSFSTSYALNAAGTAVAAADFDRDGRIDLVVADRAVVTPYFGNGDGTFTKGSPLSSFSVSSLAVGDIDHDGRPDIIAGGQSEITVFVYAGARQFRLNGINGLSSDSQTVTLTDLDGDANLDVVSVGNGDIAVLRGSPGGRLLPQTIYAGGANSVAGAVGDFDRDGLNDIVVANYISADVSVLHNLGGGEFDAMRKLEGGIGASGFASADVNLDFRPDLLVANQTSNDLLVYFGKGAGGFETAFGYSLGFSPKSLRMGDIDGDQLPDVAMLSADGKTVGVMFGQREGTFKNLTTITFPRPLCCIELGDLNGDNFADLVYAEVQGTLGVRLSQGVSIGTIFGAATTYPVPQDVTALAVGDLDLDHNRDVVVATATGMFTFTGSPSGALSASALIDVRNAGSLAIGLVTGDNLPDIVAGTTEVVVIAGDFTGTFQSQTRLATPTNQVTYLTLADLDGDGTNDIAASNFSTSSAEHFVSVFLNHGAQGFEILPATQTDSEPGAILAADFTDDKVAELVISAGGKALFARGRCAPPAVTIAGPRVALPGQPITLVANAVAGSARRATFTFLVDGKFAGAKPTDPLEPGIARLTVVLPAGQHTISAIALYPEGEGANSDVIPLVVASGKRRAVKH